MKSLRFSKFFRVSWFWTKLFESSTDLHRFGFVNVLEQERGKFQYSPVFYSEIRTVIFRNLSNLILLCWFLAWIPKINRWFSSSSLPVQIPWISFLLLLDSPFCDRAWVRCFWRWIRAWIVEGVGSVMRIQHWISESYHELHGICLNSILEN